MLHRGLTLLSNGLSRGAVSSDGAAHLILIVLALLLAAIGAVAWWVASHPERRCRRQIEFLIRRFKPEGAFGLSFTLGLIVLAASTWIFGGVLEDVLGQEEIALFDAPIVSYIASHRVTWLTTSMLVITYLGSGAFLVAVVIAGGLVMRYRTGSWSPLLLIASTWVGAMTLDLVVKLAIARPRPPAEWMAVAAVGWAFPSGHTTQSTAVYCALAYLIAETLATWRAKVGVLAIAAVAAFLIGISRVYLGVHWPTDVMGGWALAFAWLAIFFTTSSTIEKVRATLPPHGQP